MEQRRTPLQEELERLSLEQHRKGRRRDAEDFTHFAGLVSAPHDFGTILAGNSSGSISLPANCHLALGYSGLISHDGDLAVGYRGRTIGTPAGLAVGRQHYLGHFEKDAPINIITTGLLVAGTFTLYALNRWRKPYAIATGTVL